MQASKLIFLCTVSWLVTRLTNLSLSSSIFPSSLKTGQVTPLLKKPGLNPSVPASYRPISNLSTLSKILEKLALSRLRQHIVWSENFCQYQSAYRAAHSTETALLQVVNDLVMAACNKSPSVLIALDISAAFDTIDHDILCQRADSFFWHTWHSTHVAAIIHIRPIKLRVRQQWSFTCHPVFIGSAPRFGLRTNLFRTRR